MADPVSLTASILAVAQTVSQIYILGKTVRDAKSDTQRLCEELLALKGILEMVQTQVNDSSIESNDDLPSAFRSQEFKNVLDSTKKFVNNILESLPETKGFKSAMQRLTWPFTKDEMNQHITRLERLKSWFMFAMLNDTLGYTSRSYVEACKMAEQFSLDKEQRQSYKQEKLTENIASWLGLVGPDAAHLKACNAHQKGTGNWFLHGDFKFWKDGRPNTVLGLSGKSGAGKTVMMSSAIEELSKDVARDESIGLAYFYCAFNDVASQAPVNILGSLLASLSSKKPDILLDFEAIFRQSKQSSFRDGPKLEDIEEILKRSFHEFSKVYVLVDALNETKNCHAVINSLARLCGKPTDNIYIMLTSIDKAIDEDLKNFPAVIRIRMGNREIMRDIEAFVEASLQNVSNLRLLKPSIRAEIRTTLIDGSHGM